MLRPPLEYVLDAEDIASARLLALGVRPRVEFSLFALVVAGLLAWSISPWSFSSLPLLIGLTASLGAFRLMQIGKLKEAALASFQRNPTLRRLTAATWDEHGVTIQPANSLTERILWSELRRLRENERIVLLVQAGQLMHAIPKRAFPDRAALQNFRALAAPRKLN